MNTKLPLSQYPNYLHSVIYPKNNECSGTSAVKFSDEELSKLASKLRTHVNELELSYRVKRLLMRKRIHQLGHLARQTKTDLMRIYNFGEKSLQEVHVALAKHDLKLGEPLPIIWPKYDD